MTARSQPPIPGPSRQNHFPADSKYLLLKYSGKVNWASHRVGYTSPRITTPKPRSLLLMLLRLEAFGAAKPAAILCGRNE